MAGATVSGMDRLARAAQRAARRLRGRAVLARAVVLLPIPLAYAVFALACVKVLRLSEASARPVWALGLVPLSVFLVGVGRTLFHRQRVWSGSLALDDFHGLRDRVTTALAFNALPSAERSPLMQVAIEDGVAVADRLEPRRAVPIRVPREVGLVLVLVGALFAVAPLEVRRYQKLPPPSTFEPLVMSADDIELFRDVAKELALKNDDPTALATARRFNQLVEDIAQRRLDRHEVFRRLGALERELKEGAELDRDLLDEGLKGLARELEKSGLTKPAAQALDERRLADAEAALRELAERLRKKAARPSTAELDRLRQALEKASRTSSERLQNIEARRRELEEQRKSLLKKKSDAADAGANADPKLKDNERKLERLDRERSRAEGVQRQLSELDKQLAQAAQDLMRDANLGARDLEAGAQDINRMARESTNDEQKRNLLRKLQELRELLRQQGKGGKDQLDRLMRFAKRARGGTGSGQEEPNTGPGSGKDGKGQPSLRFGSSSGSGVSIPIPGMGKQAAGAAPGARAGDQASGAGDGPGAGSGHDPGLKGDASDLKGKTHDVTAAGIDTGQGTASSEVIYGAAERGFVGRGYKNVFTEYHTVAEENLRQDEIPSGYRFYVRRYFQLIRPRE